ncbi:MAG: serine/threonine protein kinase/tetratricopeptide (TPR) repeat protein [Myxococcota bacterium]
MDLRLPPRYRPTSDPLLGEGGMGRVLRVHDVLLDLPVALKIVRPDLAADVRFRKLFNLEIRISARFSHQHIVPLHDHGETPDGTPFLGLAYADAGSFAALRDAPPEWPELRRLSVELLDALAHLHARDVLHRDLKPENVLLHSGPDGGPHVWLADLGLANATSALARKRGRMEGTPGFMSPEQYLGLPRDYGPWTDLYSVGVMLWEICTGSRPFADDQTALSAPLPEFAPRDGMEVPDGLETILANLLAPEPLSRYDLAADLRTELLALGRARRWEGPRAPEPGTIAPSAPSVSAPESDEPVNDRSTLFDLSASDLTGDGRDRNVPRWNRPFPAPLPVAPPEPSGLGATARASLSLFAMREIPLVARGVIRRQLWSAAREVGTTGRPRVVLVIGEAGSGKSKIVESISKALEEGGWAETVRFTHERPTGREDGYAGAARGLLRPWNESRQSLTARLKRRLARERGHLDARVEEEADTLARWCGLLEPEEDPVPAGIGLREVYRHLESQSWRGLSCLVVEDAHWATQEGDGLAVAEAVLQAADDTDSRRLLVLVTLRSEALQRDRALAARVDALLATGATRVDVPRLDRAGTVALLAESLTLAPALADQVAERCEGNPLFARQLLMSWAEQGWLVDTGRLQFGLADGVDADAVLPGDAEALLLDRAESTAEASGNARRFRDALHMAALSGRAVPRALLMALAGPELEDFTRGCGLWVERDDALVLDSSLLHQALLAQTNARKDLSYLHRRLGKSWARYGEATSEQVDLQVGRHAARGRDPLFALAHLTVAAEVAWQRGRTTDLDEASELALGLTSPDDLTSSFLGWAQLWRARALAERGEPVEAGRLFAEASASLEAEGEALGTVQALVGLGRMLLRQGDLAGAEARYTSAIDRARTAGDLAGEASAIAGKAWLEQQKRNFHGADILFARVQARREQLHDARGIANATLGQAFVARRTGSFDDAEELYEEAHAAFLEGDDPLGAARARIGMAIAARQRRRFSEAEEWLREGQTAAEELGATTVLMDARLALADLYRHRGEADRAHRIYSVHSGWAERAHQFESAILSHLGIAHIARGRGDLHGMFASASAASRYLERVPGHWLWATYRLMVATQLAMQGDHATTWQWLWSASELGLGDTVDSDTADCLVAIVEVADTSSWGNVLRVAGKLATDQLEALGQSARLAEVRARLPAPYRST